MAKNIFTVNSKSIPYQWGLNDEAGKLNEKVGQKDFSPTATNVIPADASKGKTVSLITPDTDGIDYLSQLLTTPEQEAEYRKDNINAQKIGLIGDVLRQVGNVITTSQGAVPQQFSASPLVGLAAEYKADKAKRDANNLRYYSAKQQERIQAAKDALAIQQMAYNLWKDKQNWDYKVSRDKANDALKKYGIEQQNARQREKMKFDAERKELDRKNATRNAYIRKSNGGSEGAGSGRYMMSPDGIWSRKTSLDTNELESAKAMLEKNGYTLPIDPMYATEYLKAQQAKDYQKMAILKSVGEEKTRNAIMQVMSQDANAAKLIGERFGFSFTPSTGTNTPQAAKTSGSTGSKVRGGTPWNQVKSGSTENDLENLTEELFN